MPLTETEKDEIFNRVTSQIETGKFGTSNLSEQEKDRIFNELTKAGADGRPPVITMGVDGRAVRQDRTQFEQAQRPLTPTETSQARAEAALTGLTFGAGGLVSPAIQATIGGLFPEGKSFKERFTEERRAFKQRQEKLREESPVLGFGLEIAGGIPTGSALARGLAAGVGAVGRAAAPVIARSPRIAQLLARAGQTLPARFARTAVGRTLGTGAGFGGTFGAGQALGTAGAEEGRLPTTGEVIRGGLGGATAGVVGAGLIGGTAGVIGAGIRQAGRATSPAKALVKRFGKDVIRKAQEEGTSLLETAQSARIGQKVIKVGKTAAKISEEAAGIIDKTVKEKLAILPKRLKGTLDELFGKAGLQDIDTTIQKFIPVRRQLFDKALAKGIDPTKTDSINKLKQLIKSRKTFLPSGRAMKVIQEIGEAEGFEVPVNLAERGFNLKNLMLTKRGISTVIDRETSFDPVTFTKKVSDVGQSFTKLQKEFLNLVDDIAPDYAIARKAVSDDFGLKEAVRFGQQALKKTPFEIEKTIKNFGDAEMEAFLVSIKDGLIEKSQRIATAENKDIITALFKASKDFSLRKRLQPILGKKNFDKFEQFLLDESIKNRTLVETGKAARQTLEAAERGIVPEEAIGFLGAIPRAIGTTIKGRTEIPFRTRTAQFLTDPELLKTINIKEATALQKLLQGQTARTAGQIGAFATGE
jgi:hypothetical protein